MNMYGLHAFNPSIKLTGLSNDRSVLFSSLNFNGFLTGNNLAQSISTARARSEPPMAASSGPTNHAIKVCPAAKATPPAKQNPITP